MTPEGAAAAALRADAPQDGAGAPVPGSSVPAPRPPVLPTRRPWGQGRIALVAVGVVAALVVVLVAQGLRIERTTLPVVGASDGLPEQVVAGQTYTATFTVDFPADWPVEDVGEGAEGTTRALVVVLGRGVGEDVAEGSPEHVVIYCSTGVLHAAGERTELECPITAPSPGPLELVLEAGEPGIMVGESTPRTVTATFEHTVVAAP